MICQKPDCAHTTENGCVRCDIPLLGMPDANAIPWDFIAPHEAQAFKNHGQSLATLRRRGGLAPSEALAIIEDRRWRARDDIDALSALADRLELLIQVSESVRRISDTLCDRDEG